MDDSRRKFMVGGTVVGLSLLVDYMLGPFNTNKLFAAEISKDIPTINQNELKKYLSKRYVVGNNTIEDLLNECQFMQGPFSRLYSKKEADVKLQELNDHNYLGSDNWDFPSAELINKQLVYIKGNNGQIVKKCLIGDLVDTSNKHNGVWLSNTKPDPNCPNLCSPLGYQAFLYNGNMISCSTNQMGLLQPVRLLESVLIKGPIYKA